MNVTQQRMAAIFNEWAKRYAVSPSEFSEIIDENGNVVKDYGESCVIYLKNYPKSYMKKTYCLDRQASNIFYTSLLTYKPIRTQK